MENFEKINALFEGDLSDNDQKKLFADLSQQDTMRNQFKSLAMMNSALKEQSQVGPIPIASSNKIFDSVGINKSKSGIFSFMNSKIFIGAASSIVTFLIMLLFWNDQSDTIIANIQDPVEQSNLINSKSDNNQIQNQKPTINDKKKEDFNQEDFSREEANYSYLGYDSTKSKENNNEIKSNDNKESILLHDDLKIDFAKEEFNSQIDIRSHNQFAAMNNFENNLLSNINENLYADKKFSFEFRGFQDWMMPESKIGPAQIAKFHNTAISLEYQVSQNHAFGFDLRNETFLMNFKGENNFGMPVNYSVHPNLISAGLYYRYSMRHLGSVYPVAQIYLGGNEIGGVGRIMSGAAIKINDFEMTFGVEYSAMLYDYQSDMYNSSKISLIYGVKCYIF